jgi:hypothetical protein
VLAVFVEQAGAARSPEEDKTHGGFAAFAVGAAALLAPGILLMHGYFVTQGVQDTLRVLALAAPVAACIVGALAGAIFGAVAPSAAPAMRMAAPWFAVAGLVLAAYAAMASFAALVAALQTGGVLVLPVTP